MPQVFVQQNQYEIMLIFELNLKSGNMLVKVSWSDSVSDKSSDHNLNQFAIRRFSQVILN